MKRQLIVGLSLGIALSVLLPVYSGAQTPANSDSKTELNDRLEKRKTVVQTRLSAAEATRVSTRCAAAQQKFTAIGKKFSDNDQPLRAKYEAYNARLAKITEKADARGIDTTELKKNTVIFNQQYQGLVTAANDFNLSISDLKSVDCKTNPNGFKATLEAARKEQKDVQAARTELSKLVKGPLLESIKSIKTTAEKGKN